MTVRSTTGRLMAGLLGVWALAAAAPPPAQAQDKGSVVIASFGGRWQDGLRKAYFEPFEKATGIKVIEATGISLAKIKTMVTTQNVEWDLGEVTPSEFLVLVNEGMLEKIDYSLIDKKIIDELEPITVHPYGISAAIFTQVISYNTRKYSPANHPHSWAEVWDTKKFPGPRIFPAGTYVIQPIEPALLADGVAPDKLYPVDLERAYRSLSKIRPDVIKWVTSSSAVPQALVDGEADIGMGALQRIAQLKSEGAPVDYEINQGLMTNDYWAIPKGAKNYKNAIKFIEFASRAEPMAEMVKLLPFGPPNRRALDLLPEALKVQLPTYPANKEKEIVLNPGSWSEKGPGGISYVEKNLQMWNAWATQQ